jgi:hypothetical protein
VSLRPRGFSELSSWLQCREASMPSAPGSSWTTREELFDWFRDLGLDEGVV